MTELSDRIKRLRDEMAKGATRRQQETYYSRAAKVGRDAAGFAWFLAVFTIGLHWAWSRIASPILGTIRSWAWWAFKLYMSLFHKFTTVRDKFGNPMLSRTRAGIAVIATWIFVWYLFWPFCGLLVDISLYTATAHVDEKIILLSSQELDPRTNLHSIEGCYVYPCGSDNSLYFRVTESWFNMLWSLTHGHGIFWPEYIASSVPSGYSRCMVTAYGIRTIGPRSWFLRPEMLHINYCRLISDNEEG